MPTPPPKAPPETYHNQESHPAQLYCNIHFLEQAGVAQRQMASRYLEELGRIGIVPPPLETGSEAYYLQTADIKLKQKLMLIFNNMCIASTYPFNKFAPINASRCGGRRHGPQPLR